MTKMLIDIDDDTLLAAQDALGTETKKDTVNLALSEAVNRIGRARAWSAAQRLAAEALDLDLLADKNSYRPKPG